MQVRPLKSKNKTEVASALKSVLNTEDAKGLTHLFTDAGREFVNNTVNGLLREHKMQWYTTHSKEIKASIAERHIRTLKERIYKYLTLKDTLRYIDVLPDIVLAYNERAHAGLKGAAPLDVHRHYTRAQCQRLFRQMYARSLNVHIKKDRSHASNQNIKVGDTVRIAARSRTDAFRKGYEIQNTEEIFKIRQIDNRQNIVGYYLEDLSGEEVKSTVDRHLTHLVSDLTSNGNDTNKINDGVNKNILESPPDIAMAAKNTKRVYVRRNNDINMSENGELFSNASSRASTSSASNNSNTSSDDEENSKF
nr:uncharacterized protein LOC113823396 [Penaeus vannamei]